MLRECQHPVFPDSGMHSEICLHRLECPEAACEASSGYFNAAPTPAFPSLDHLRKAMTQTNPSGGLFLDYLLEGDYFAGKATWVNPSAFVRQAYEAMVAANPFLISESPYQPAFARGDVRVRGENKVFVARLDTACQEVRRLAERHRKARETGACRPRAIFAGGPAAKIGALLSGLQKNPGDASDIVYVLDGAEQSNESGSASYEHVNHANALNAELDNTGLGILGTALRRAIFGEADASVALGVDYRKVDLWPRGLRLRDVPVYLHNEWHGLVQRVRKRLGRPTDHLKSRLASKVSTQILTEIERQMAIRLRLDQDSPRAVFLYLSRKNHEASLVDNEELAEDVGLAIRKLDAASLEAFYGPGILGRVTSGDLFLDNGCIRHGFDRLCMDAMVRNGIECRHRQRLSRIYFEESGRGAARAVAVTLEDVNTGVLSHLAVDHLCLSLGPTATFHYETTGHGLPALSDRLGFSPPVPYQTIATGLSAQLLFRITDPDKVRNLPFTGMKQTHFVEIGRTSSHVVMKLTCGGVIGLPVYSRSYAINALASILAILTPECGLAFEDVICAWPCTRGINGSNNGQIVRLGDNAVARFGEGGTGMSKMGSNAQTMLDLAGMKWPVSPELRLDPSLYRHTVIDRRRNVARRLGLL